MAISRLDRAKQFMAFDALKGLQEAYREKEIIYEEKPMDILLMATDGRGILINSALIPEKTTRTAAGVILMSLKKGQRISEVYSGDAATGYPSAAKYKKTKIPSPGVLPRVAPEQITIGEE